MFHNTIDLKGLPWKTTEGDISRFLKNCKILKIEIIFDDYWKHSGLARVQLDSEDDLRKAIKCHKNFFDIRKIEVTKVLNNENTKKEISSKETTTTKTTKEKGNQTWTWKERYRRYTRFP